MVILCVSFHQLTIMTSTVGGLFLLFLVWCQGFPCGSPGKESTCSAGDLGLIPGLGKSPGEGKGYPLQYSGLENSMDCIGSIYEVFSSSMGSQRVRHNWATYTCTFTFKDHSSMVISLRLQVTGEMSDVEQEQLKWVKGQRSGVTCWEWKGHRSKVIDWPSEVLGQESTYHVNSMHKFLSNCYNDFHNGCVISLFWYDCQGS